MTLTRKTRRQPEGVSLALTLLIMTLLLTLGSAFLGLSFSESRSSRFLQESTFAQRAAQWGLGYFLSYMSVPGAWRTIDVPQDAAKTLTIPGYSLRVSGGSGDPNFPQNWVSKNLEIYGQDLGSSLGIPIGKEPPAQLGDLSKVAPEDIRYLRVVEPLTLPGDNLQANVEAWMVTLRSSTGHLPPFQPEQYMLAVRGTVRKADGSGEGRRRTVVARVREALATDYAIFQSNLTSWDRPGFSPLDFLTSVSLPKGYSVMGRLRVDGMISGAPPGVISQSGVLRFESTEPSDYKFLRGISWQSVPGNPAAHKDHTGIANTTTTYDKFFPKGYTWFPPLGLPGTKDYLDRLSNPDTSHPDPTRGTAAKVADFKPDSGNVSGLVILNQDDGQVGIKSGSNFFRADGSADNSTLFNVGFVWPDNSIPNTASVSFPAVTSAASSDPGGHKALGASHIDYLEATQPRFARVDITVDGDTVRVRQFDAFGRENTSFALSGASSAETRTTGIKLNRLKGRTIFVEGGNVQFSAPNGMDGLLTVICSENRQRKVLRPPGAAPASTRHAIYIDRLAWLGAAADPVLTRIRDHHPPWRVPYSGSPSQTRWVWPLPPAETIGSSVFRAGDPEYSSANSSQGIDPVVNLPHARFHPRAVRSLPAGEIMAHRAAREGNIFITGHVRYKAGTNTALGLIAENYVFLPDCAPFKTEPKGLEVQGVLTSLRHAVQYINWSQLDTADPTRTNVQLNFVGSIVSKYPDVIGLKDSQRGYYSQRYKHDSNLRNLLPPNFPLWDRTATDFMKRPVEYVVVSTEDQARQGSRN